MNKQQAIEIIEREPVGGAHYHNTHSGMYYNLILGKFYVFDGEWKFCTPNFTVACGMMKMSKILEITLGED